MDVSVREKGVYAFDGFQLDPVRRRLLRNAANIPLPPRLFDTLLYLVENAGRVIEKDELFGAVWGTRIVEEANLSQTIFALRKALQTHGGSAACIATATGRGYRFAADVKLESGASEVSAQLTADKAAETVPTPARAVRRYRVIGVSAVCVSVVVAALVWLDHRSPTVQEKPRPRLSIIVLPIANLSADRDKDYLADAIADDLTTDLSQMPGSLVIARQTAESYRNHAEPVTQIGRELNVRYALEGSIRPDGDVLRVNAQLIDAQSGTQVWAERFDVAKGDVSAAESAIEGRILNSLNIELTEIESVRSAQERPHNQDALDLLLRARALANRHGNTYQGLVQEEQYLKDALSMEPEFVDAMVQLSRTLIAKGHYKRDSASAREDWDQAHALLKEAIAIRPRNARALSEVAYLAAMEGRHSEAEQASAAALAISPDDPNALWSAAVTAKYEGQSEKAAKYGSLYLLRNPRSVNSYLWRMFLLGEPYIALGEYDRAIQIFQSAVATPGGVLADNGSPDLEQSTAGLIAAEAMSGRVELARKLYQDFSSKYPNRTIWNEAANKNRLEAESSPASHYMSGLRLAGMPDFIDEHRDTHLPPQEKLLDSDDYIDTPTAVPGAVTLDTAGLRALRVAMPNVLVVDDGEGAALPDGAFWAWKERAALFADESPDAILTTISQHALKGKDTPVVIMGDGPLGSFTYNAVSAAVKAGYKHVYWYRGGEQSWAQAKLPAHDVRP